MDPNNRMFHTTFFISLIVHAVILFPMPTFTAALSKPEISPAMMYLALQVPPAVKNFNHELRKPEKAAPLSEQKKVASRKELLPAQPDKNSLKTGNSPAVPVPAPEKSTELPQKPESKPVITTKETTSNDLSKDKTYISYYRLINEQLRQCAICPVNFSEGEIEVSFVLTADGQLRSVEVLSNTSCPDNFLRETALQIVKRASPFPPFPTNIQQAQLTFNVVICFRERS